MSTKHLLLIIATFATALLHVENWPQFRGPTGQGVSTETGLPLKWRATKNVAWKTAVPGESWSLPIIWGDRVFVTTATEGGQSCRVLSLDRKTGMILWDKEVFKQTPRRKADCNPHATPTARLSQFLETSPNRLLDGMKPPDPVRTARIKKALARRRAPAKRTSA